MTLGPSPGRTSAASGHMSGVGDLFVQVSNPGPVAHRGVGKIRGSVTVTCGGVGLMLVECVPVGRGYPVLSVRTCVSKAVKGTPGTVEFRLEHECQTCEFLLHSPGPTECPTGV